MSLPEDHLALSLELFDHIDLGLIICDDDGTIRFANQAAERELRHACTLRRSGPLLDCGAHDLPELLRAISQAAHRGRRGLINLQSPSDRLLLTCVPFGGSGQQVLIMLGRRMTCSDLGLEMLAGCYHLTLSEKRVLSALIRGIIPKDIASERGVSVSTIRTQIQTLRAKLGATSVDHLLLLTAKVPPIAGALRLARAVEWGSSLSGESLRPAA